MSWNAISTAAGWSCASGSTRGLKVYVPSLSARLVSYKGLLTSPQLADFYADLADPAFETGLAIFHRRYSTNTYPNWTLAQPFRLLVPQRRDQHRPHEPATPSTPIARGLSPPLPGGDLLTPKMSDSASLDEWVEHLVLRQGLEPAARAAPDRAAGVGHRGRLLGPGGGRPVHLLPADLRQPVRLGRPGRRRSPPTAACSSGLVDRMGLRPVRWCSDKRGWLYIGQRVGRVRPRHDRPSSPAASSSRGR